MVLQDGYTDLLPCGGNGGYDSPCRGCCTHCCFPGSYPQIREPCEENAPRNYEGSSESLNDNGDKRVDVEKLKYEVDEMNGEVENYSYPDGHSKHKNCMKAFDLNVKYLEEVPHAKMSQYMMDGNKNHFCYPVTWWSDDDDEQENAETGNDYKSNGTEESVEAWSCEVTDNTVQCSSQYTAGNSKDSNNQDVIRVAKVVETPVVGHPKCAVENGEQNADEGINIVTEKTQTEETKLEGVMDRKNISDEEADVLQSAYPGYAVKNLDLLDNVLEKYLLNVSRLPLQETRTRFFHETKYVLDEAAAVALQSAYRGYAVRKLDLLNKMRKIADVREQVADVGDRIHSRYSAIEVGEKQRQILEEKIMRLLLQLDSLEDLPANIRETRKSLARELTGLQKMLDCSAAEASEKCHKEVSSEHVVRNKEASEGEEDEAKQLESGDKLSEHRQGPSEPSRVESKTGEPDKGSEAERPVKPCFISKLPLCGFLKYIRPVKPWIYSSFCRFTKSEKPVVSSEVFTDLAPATQSRNLIKDSEELRKLVPSAISQLYRLFDVVGEKLAANQKLVRGKRAKTQLQYEREVYNQIDEEEQIYVPTDQQGHVYDQYYHDESITCSTEDSLDIDQFDQNLEEVMELVCLVLLGLIVWGLVWFL